MDIIKFYDEARKANEQKAQDLKVFSRSQKDEGRPDESGHRQRDLQGDGKYSVRPSAAKRTSREYC